MSFKLMVKVPDISRVADKWERKASAAVADYEEGVKNPREDWKSATLAAKDAYYAALQQIIANKTWEKGVARVDTSYWQKMCLEKGRARYSEGIRLGKSKYIERMGKVLDILKGITLPPRKPRGDPANLERVRIIMDTLHKAKVEGRI